MLVYTRRSVLRYNVVARGLNLIGEFLDKSNQAMLFLFSPEDTSVPKGELRLSGDTCSGIHIPGLMKALFWAAFSIAVALMVGQLG